MPNPLPRQTIFLASDDNESCADELIVALSKQGIQGLKEAGPKGDGPTDPWSVKYACTDDQMASVMPLIIEIEASLTSSRDDEPDSDDQPNT